MIFFKMLKHDLRNGLLKRWQGYGAALCFFLFLCVDFYFQIRHCAEINAGSFGDFLFYVFGGMKEYRPEMQEPFQFPAVWTLTLVLIFYITLYYPFHDLMGYGRGILLQSRSRIKWWGAKCAWAAAAVLLFFVLLWSVLLLFCLLLRRPIVMDISAAAYGILGAAPGGNRGIVMQQQLTMELMLLPALTVIALSLFQMFLSLFIKPLYSFVTTVSVLIASAYYSSGFMIGNYAMALRSVRVSASGVPLANGICFALALSAFSVAAGMLVFRRYDILNKE